MEKGYYDKATVSTKNLRTRIKSIFKVFRKLRVHPDTEAFPNNSELERDITAGESLVEIANRVGRSLHFWSWELTQWCRMWIFQESSVEDENSDEEEEGQDKQTVTNTEAVDCFKKRLTWMVRENNVALFNCSSSVEWWSLRRAHTVANWNNLIYFSILGWNETFSLTVRTCKYL